MKKYFTILLSVLYLFITDFTKSQDTFSICAVDPVTGQVGSAGASCVNDCTILTDVHPGYGVVHTQASWLSANQNYARNLMNLMLPPQAIIDSLVLHDAQNNPLVRQYGIVDLINGGRVAAYTGSNCINYKNHILGPTYSIQGNILLGQRILDSMKTRFLNTPGSLAAKLMAALQGAKVIGADTRCSTWNTSSKSAFIRVANIGDPLANLYINLKVLNAPFGRDPIDSLQVLFNNLPYPGIKLNLSVLFEGMYSAINNRLSRKDSVNLILRNTSSPFAIIDSSKRRIDSLTFSALFTFLNASSGQYYIVAKHFNTIETWSKSGGEILFNHGSIHNYDFTSASSQAFGNNMILKGSKYCLYSGDVDRNGFIDIVDVISIYNESIIFTTGNYLPEDLNADLIVDVSDVTLCYNNSLNFVGVITP